MNENLSYLYSFSFDSRSYLDPHEEAAFQGLTTQTGIIPTNISSHLRTIPIYLPMRRLLFKDLQHKQEPFLSSPILTNHHLHFI